MLYSTENKPGGGKRGIKCQKALIPSVKNALQEAYSPYQTLVAKELRFNIRLGCATFLLVDTILKSEMVTCTLTNQ